MAAERFYGPGQYARVDPLLVSMPHPEATIALLAGRAVITAYVATPPFIAALRKSDKIHAVLRSKDTARKLPASYSGDSSRLLIVIPRPRR
jgi:NitT/TauT family transport system substrate-binding protein